jgi:hypothetical protein
MAHPVALFILAFVLAGNSVEYRGDMIDSIHEQGSHT